MRHHAFRQLLSGAFLLTGIALAQSLALAQCPPNPSGPNQTVTTLPACCDFAFVGHPCGVDPQRIDISGSLLVPTATVTPDPGDPTKVNITRTGGSMTVTSYGACVGAHCSFTPLSYIWTPFRRDTVLSTSTLSWTRNYPNSAWIGGNPDYVDLTKVTPAQCSVRSNWSMGNNSAITLPGQSETFDLGCSTLISKPSPMPSLNQCPPQATPSPVSCQNSNFDPVDPYSGDYFYAESDLVVPGIIPLSVIRTYTSSQTGLIGSFGVGTYLKGYDYALDVPLNGDGTVNTNPDQEIQVNDGSGLLVPFTNGPSGGLTFADKAHLGTAGSALVLTLDGSNHLASAMYTTSSKLKLHFGPDSRLSAIEDINGNTVTLTRGTGGRLEEVSSLGRSLLLSYNLAGLIEKIEDHTGRTVKYEYSGNQELLRVTNPVGNATSYTWDASHRVQTMVDKTSNVRFLNYYASNGMVKQQALKMGGSLTTSGIYKLDAPNSNIRIITDPQGNIRTYTYNNQGLLTEFKDGLNHADTITYSANLFDGTPTGRYIEQTDALNHTTRYDLNLNNLPTSITNALNEATQITYDTTWPSKPASITNERGKTTTFTYDSSGNLVTLTDANGKDTTYTYNGRGQVLTTTNPLGKTTTYTYNTVGDLLTVEDPLGNTTTMTYDNLGRMITLTDANNHTTQYAYNLDNSLSLITDPNGKTIEYSYNQNGQVRQIRDKLNHLTLYSYDRKGRLTQISRPGLNLTSITYDTGDRITRISDDLNNQQNFTYDAANRITKNVIRQGTTTQFTYDYAYDDADRLLTVTEGANTWTYSYDDANRVTGLVSPQGTVGYEYSPTGYRTKLIATGMSDVTYSYDDLDRLTALAQGLENYTYSYDDHSRLTSLTRPNGVNTSYAYDDADRLTQIHHLKTSVLDDQYDYTHDDVGNIVTESRDGGTRTYTYDALNQLIQMDKTVAVLGEDLPKKIEYTYDANGNLTQRKDTDDSNVTQTTSYTYNTANYLTQVTPPVGSSVTLTYNGYGALTGDSSGRSFTWDSLQRLTQMTAGGVTTNFTYDPLGRRTSMSRTGLSKTYFYDGLDILSDGSNSYLNGPGLDNPLRLNDGTNNRYYLQNQIGSVTRLSDGSGASIGHYQYLPYGGLLSSSTPLSGSPYTFTGREDDGTGLLYYRARYYDPSLQNFLSQDPLGDDQRYVGGNPLLYKDPFGLDLWIEGSVPGEGGFPFHESVCVGNLQGPRTCGSFGRDKGQNPFNGRGSVYSDTSSAGPIVPGSYVVTSPSIDVKMQLDLINEFNKPGAYNVFNNNCRTYSRKKYSKLKNDYVYGNKR